MAKRPIWASKHITNTNYLWTNICQQTRGGSHSGQSEPSTPFRYKRKPRLAMLLNLCELNTAGPSERCPAPGSGAGRIIILIYAYPVWCSYLFH